MLTHMPLIQTMLAVSALFVTTPGVGLISRLWCKLMCSKYNQ